MEQIPSWASASILAAIMGLLTWVIKRIVADHGKQRREDRIRFIRELRSARRMYARELDKQREDCRTEHVRIDALWSNHLSTMRESQKEIIAVLEQIAQNVKHWPERKG